MGEGLINMIFLAANEKDFLDKLEIAKQAKIGIELLQFISYEALYNEEKITEIMNSTQGIPLVIHAPYELFSLSNDKIVHDTVMSHCKRALLLANRFGAKRVVFHTGYIAGSKSKKYAERFQTNAKSFFSNLCGEGIEIAIENVREDIAFMKKIAPECCKICLDIGHVNIYSKEPLDSWIENFGKSISHIHLHNNDGEFDNHSVNGNMDLVKISKMFDCDISIEAFGDINEIRSLLEKITAHLK